MPGKRILAFEFSNFSGGGPRAPTRSFAPSALASGFCAPAVCALFRGCTPIPEILDPPLISTPETTAESLYCLCVKEAQRTRYVFQLRFGVTFDHLR
jgi:hypothetical protein